ncbi:MAG: accessory gene regulator B family protein [Clostridium argentinense]|uniref:accessory gene regulator ArgB-like protein n=1 Tax=Clostridium butanoliproducens TaxID=2991837 RepID=UPI001E014014|nr:accessory gene regulator B family protein [Clostridium butanoliproducens]MBS5824180.1 accessory gene regulator B family protein [Clostridium argentinense]MDU1350249.1 accessory gene regulator B family protein [Clostridium argentinense]
MVNKISSKICTSLIQNKIINEDDLEIYMYGLTMLLITIGELIGLVLLGVIFGWLKEIIFFTIIFFFMRLQAGGYHASTPMRCFLSFAVLSNVPIFLLKNIDLIRNPIILIIMLLIALIIFIKLAPQDTVNKPLDEDEKKIYKKRTFITYFVEVAIIIALFMINKDLNIYCYIGSAAIFIEAVSLLI